MRILGDRLLLSPLPVKEVSDGGIYLPQGQAGDKMVWWRVDQLGTGVKDDVFQVGSTVVTPLYFSHFEFDDGTRRKIVGCDQIHGVLEPAMPDI